MYVAKNPFCRPSVRSACMKGDGRGKFLNFAKFRNLARTHPLGIGSPLGFKASIS